MPKRLKGKMSIVREDESIEGFDTSPRSKRKVICESGSKSEQKNTYSALDKSRQLTSEWPTARA